MRLGICIISMFLGAVLSLNADEIIVAKVTKVDKDTLTLDAGGNRGLKAGLKGRVYYIIGTDNIYIANISLIAVVTDESSAKVEEQTAPVKVGYFAEINVPPGWLHVTSSPEGADIGLDGKKTGRKTPTRIEVSAGSHTVEVHWMNDEYGSASEPVQVIAGEEKQVSLTLPPSWGTLYVTSAPEGADIWLDGKETKEKTPARIKVKAGGYRVEARLDDYESVSELVRVPAGEEKRVQLTLLNIRRILTQLNDISTRVNDISKALSSLLLALPKQNTQRIDIVTQLNDIVTQLNDILSSTPAGHPDILKQIKDIVTQVEVLRLRGTIEVTSSPSGAGVYRADNNLLERTPTTLEGPAGKHELILRKKGYQDAPLTIQIRKGENLPVNITLPPVPNKPEIQKSRTQMVLYSLILPGLGQYYGGRHSSSVLFLLTGLGAAAGAVATHLQYNQSVDAYNSSVFLYNWKVDPYEIEQAKQTMIKAHDEADRKFLLRQVTFAAVGGVWLLNVMHALIAGPARPSSSPLGKVDPYWEIVPRAGLQNAGVLVRYRF
ncbi:PEGA domain-containing protein [Candidatus Poribacteria bacterium]|nr:PEGA domain-containing protein [Candidatus Poribacteria bacterium]